MNADHSLSKTYGGWAVIAGASNGIGRAFALALAEAGFNLLLVARSEALLNELAAEIRTGFGVEAESLVLDLSDGKATDALLTTIGTRDIGFFLYCAGAESSGTSFVRGTLSQWRDVIGLNILTFAETIHGVAARMAEAKRGAIVLISSEAAFGGTARASIYTATKAFGLNLGESLWAELKPYGVDVLSVVIGATDTPTLRAALKRSGVAFDPSLLPQPETIAARSLEKLADGPTLILLDSEDSLPASTEAGRRHRVEQRSGYLTAFYGPE